jgi:hypothetical protein
LLSDDPELLALAEAIASLRPQDISGAAHAGRRRQFCRSIIDRLTFFGRARQRL